MLKFSAPCIFGLEGLCANEFKFLGLKNVEAHNGKVTFEGDFSDMARQISIQDMPKEFRFCLQSLRR